MNKYEQIFVKMKKIINTFFIFRKNSTNLMVKSSTKKSILVLFIGIIAAATTHANEIKFTFPKDTTLRLVSNGKTNITNGQTMGTYDIDVFSQNGGLKIKIQAGRKKSTEVATAFNQSIIKAISTVDKDPDQLNFYVGYTLYINGLDATTLYLAQGSTGLYNPWWVGSTLDKPAAGKDVDHDCYITVTANDIDYYITAKGRSEFEISKQMPSCTDKPGKPSGVASPKV